MQFRALLVGDVVGKPGRRALAVALPGLLADRSIDVVIVNGENVAGGSGITPALFEEFRALGVDVVTMGDHVFRRREIVPLLQESDRILRPANLPPEAAGRGWTVLESPSGFPFAVVNLLGRTFMKPAGDCPFHAADRALADIGDRAKLIFVDFHAEATSERIALGWHLDGRATAVCGTHTHVQTADERVLPGGTAYISDLGMTGPHDSILGRKKEKVLSVLVTGMPTHFDVATADARLSGALVTADTQTGRATAIERLSLPISPGTAGMPWPDGEPAAKGEEPETPEPADNSD